ncbi:MAG: peptidase [Bacteroidetes bacterium B1(2017)]|nr:MAG: peptidase [Bacteroidetes bacterium B1(2017)]
MPPFQLYFILLFNFWTCTPSSNSASKTQEKPAGMSYVKTKQKAKEALAYCQAKGYNTQRCILIDMSVHSGLNRFVLWDFKRDTIVHTSLVGHGCCDNNWNTDESKDKPKFSNTDGSHCSALGKYKIGQRAYSNWGVHIKYELHGLENSNSNAYARLIVFHSWEAVTNEEVYPNGTPEGWGCPTLSNESFLKVDPLIKNSSKNILLWIYK